MPEPIGATSDGIFSTKCLACNRPYQYPQKQEIPEVPRQRSLGVMPPSATADLDVAGTRAPVDRRQVRIATPPRRLRVRGVLLSCVFDEASEGSEKPVFPRGIKSRRAQSWYRATVSRLESLL